MANRLTLRLRRIPMVVLLVVISCALVIGQAANFAATDLLVRLSALTKTVIAIGGRGDSTSVNVQNKLNHSVVPSGYVYDQINYPATIQLSASTAIATPLVYTAIKDPAGQQLIVAGYSEGTLAAEAAKRQLVSNNSGPSDPTQLKFLMIASPFAGNGGIFARFPGISVPFIVNNMGPAQASPYETTYVTNEYDPYGDFPAYFNPLSLLNSLLAVQYAHPDKYYDSIDLNTTPSITTTVGNSKYVFVLNKDLPLLAPLRQGAAMFGLTALTKPIFDAIEPALRVLIDMGYTDRQNLNPATPTPFSLFTPKAKIDEAMAALPGAINQGIANFTSDLQSLSGTTPVPAVSPASTAAKKPALAAAPEPASQPEANTPAPQSLSEQQPQQPEKPAADVPDSDTAVKPEKDTKTEKPAKAPLADLLKKLTPKETAQSTPTADEPKRAPFGRKSVGPKKAISPAKPTADAKPSEKSTDHTAAKSAA